MIREIMQHAFFAEFLQFFYNIKHHLRGSDQIVFKNLPGEFLECGIILHRNYTETMLVESNLADTIT